MRDATLDWLIENDPAAVGISRRAYSRDVGVLTPQTESDIAAREMPFSSFDSPGSFHCRKCRRKAVVEEYTVE